MSNNERVIDSTSPYCYASDGDDAPAEFDRSSNNERDLPPVQTPTAAARSSIYMTPKAVKINTAAFANASNNSNSTTSKTYINSAGLPVKRKTRKQTKIFVFTHPTKGDSALAMSCILEAWANLHDLGGSVQEAQKFFNQYFARIDNPSVYDALDEHDTTFTEIYENASECCALKNVMYSRAVEAGGMFTSPHMRTYQVGFIPLPPPEGFPNLRNVKTIQKSKNFPRGHERLPMITDKMFSEVAYLTHHSKASIFWEGVFFQLAVDDSKLGRHEKLDVNSPGNKIRFMVTQDFLDRYVESGRARTAFRKGFQLANIVE